MLYTLFVHSGEKERERDRAFRWGKQQAVLMAIHHTWPMQQEANGWVFSSHVAHRPSHLQQQASKVRSMHLPLYQNLSLNRNGFQLPTSCSAEPEVIDLIMIVAKIVNFIFHPTVLILNTSLIFV